MFPSRFTRAPFDDPTSEAEVPPDERLDPAGVMPTPDRAAALRALRELEAAKSRLQRDADRVLRETREKLVLELLPVLDDLDRTVDAARRSGDAPTVLEGAVLVRGRFEAVLRGYGALRLDAVGTPFDPQVHEAIATTRVTDPRSHRVVVEQLQPGYLLGDRLLRPAKVVVGVYAGHPA
jgi:molecular chaperone GrpE (heat shock protein)